MRKIVIAAAVAVLGMAAACGQGGSAPTPKGEESAGRPGAEPTVTATTSQAAPPIYVRNLHGAEAGRDDQRPANLVLSEFSVLNGITWKSWGPDRAVGTGGLSGSWCLPGCLKKQYEATVTLSGVTTVKGTRYFTRFDVDGDFPKPGDPADALVGSLPTP
ncbi:hypothetical protein [Microtetraspora sp. NBRC 16547]|uniref:hypothetical protein n=1 Tax=Microtetraspora sp. NBRC 16547 TaxID=3030993 RepID=UPI0024A03FB2|nr:hypothetical protein [Microtetraspora sp. NBRC 16547]GLX02914.1 hypothetical protein Misp02_70000 [Microtetraspora sp. NBRC 16547]